MTAEAVEASFDGLVGPTHNYAGLSHGNVASTASGGQASSPRRAVLEGLEKMRALAELGVPQFVLPPQERPDLGALRRIIAESECPGFGRRNYGRTAKLGVSHRLQPRLFGCRHRVTVAGAEQRIEQLVMAGLHV